MVATSIWIRFGERDASVSIRKKYDERCAHCLMKQDICLCAVVPKLALATKIIVLVSKREVLIPTNTGRLACQALVNSALIVHGDRDQPYDLRDHVLPGGSHLILYPSTKAQILSADFAETLARPCTLIVPDGNWRQTSKMRRRDEFLASLPQVTLPAGRPSNYGVRKENKAGGLATIEAIARSLGILESGAAQQSLENLMDEMVHRVLRSRGAGSLRGEIC